MPQNTSHQNQDEEEEEDYEFKQSMQTQTDRRGREDKRPSSKVLQKKSSVASNVKSVNNQNNQRSESGGRLR
jgi:hypothetical protein